MAENIDPSLSLVAPHPREIARYDVEDRVMTFATQSSWLPHSSVAVVQRNALTVQYLSLTGTVGSKQRCDCGDGSTLVRSSLLTAATD